MAQYNASSPTFTTLTVIMGLASTLAMVLRALARKKSNASLGLDDVFAAIALSGYLAFLGIIMWMARNVAGYSPMDLPPPVLETFLKGLYFLDILAPLPPAAGRFSLLFLYNRVFAVDRRFHIAVRLVGIVNGFWYIGCTVALCLRCVPPRKTWDPLIKGQCINAIAFVLAAGIPDSFLDFAMIILPIGVLRALQMSLRHKIDISLVFVLGGFVGLIGFIRTAITYRPEKYNTNDGDIWLCIQLGFSVICCCLPIYRPLLPKNSVLFHARSLISSLMSIIRTSPTSSTTLDSNSPYRSRLQHYNNLNDREDGVTLTKATRESDAAEQHVAGRDFPMNAINIKSTVEMV